MESFLPGWSLKSCLAPRIALTTWLWLPWSGSLPSLVGVLPLPAPPASHSSVPGILRLGSWPPMLSEGAA